MPKITAKMKWYLWAWPTNLTCNPQGNSMVWEFETKEAAQLRKHECAKFETHDTSPVLDYGQMMTYWEDGK